MVLDIPGGLFGQGDVRETATTDTSGLFGTVWTCVGTAFDATNPDTDQVKKMTKREKLWQKQMESLLQYQLVYPMVL